VGGAVRSIGCRRAVPTFLGPNVSPILYQSDEAQKRSTCFWTIGGEYKCCWPQTEPDAGGRSRQHAYDRVRQGDHYVINGVKRLHHDTDDAHFTQLIAATDRSKGSHGGISAFIVDMKAPGVKLLARAGADGRRPTVGKSPSRTSGCRSRIARAEGRRFRHAQHWLNVGRVRHGARSMA